MKKLIFLLLCLHNSAYANFHEIENDNGQIQLIADFLIKKIYDVFNGNKKSIERYIRSKLKDGEYTEQFAIQLAKNYYFIYGRVIDTEKMIFNVCYSRDPMKKWGLLKRVEQFLDIGVDYGFSIKELILNDKIPKFCCYVDNICLDLSYLKIESLEGLDVLSGLGYVEWLFLDHNQIGIIEEYSFIFATRLLNLYLHNNKINNLSNNAFTGLSCLRMLKLSDNEIREIKPNSFNSLFNISSLYLRNNPLLFIDSLAFDDNRKITCHTKTDTYEAVSSGNKLPQIDLYI